MIYTLNVSILRLILSITTIVFGCIQNGFQNYNENVHVRDLQKKNKNKNKNELQKFRMKMSWLFFFSLYEFRLCLFSSNRNTSLCSKLSISLSHERVKCLVKILNRPVNLFFLEDQILKKIKEESKLFMTGTILTQVNFLTCTRLFKAGPMIPVTCHSPELYNFPWLLKNKRIRQELVNIK